LAVFLSVALMFADKHLSPIKELRSVIGIFITPVQWVSGVPSLLGVWAEEAAVSRATLQEENSRLRNEALILKQKVQQMVS